MCMVSYVHVHTLLSSLMPHVMSKIERRKRDVKTEKAVQCRAIHSLDAQGVVSRPRCQQQAPEQSKEHLQCMSECRVIMIFISHQYHHGSYVKLQVIGEIFRNFVLASTKC